MKIELKRILNVGLHLEINCIRAYAQHLETCSENIWAPQIIVGFDPRKILAILYYLVGIVSIFSAAIE